MRFNNTKYSENNIQGVTFQVDFLHSVSNQTGREISLQDSIDKSLITIEEDNGFPVLMLRYHSVNCVNVT